VELVLRPYLVASQTTPIIVLAPLFLVWFGFGILSKVVVSFLIAFFPIVIDTVVGMRSVEPEMLHLARSLGARPLQVFAKFRFPKALPNIFGGLKVGITLAVVGAIVGEFIGANAGLGYLQLQANSNLDTTLLFSTIVVLSVMGVALFAVISALERVVIRWRPPEEVEAAHATM
ncbi:MAG: ABC transporter permease, partial [Deltaproteobacteria bacterium]|nr:ABC transporter permease [Deltaproteobacteria bacterium]